MLDTGALETDVQYDETLATGCPFVFKGQLSPAEVPAAILRELEEEIQHPTGVSTIRPPPIILQGALLSEKCGILLEMKDFEGLRSLTFFRKVTTCEFQAITCKTRAQQRHADAGSAALVYTLLLFALLHQMSASRTPAGLARLSRWTFLIQSGTDAVAFAGHITFAVLASGRPSIALLVPAFFACILFIYEAVSSSGLEGYLLVCILTRSFQHFALMIQQIQLPEDMTSRPLPVVPIPPLGQVLSVTTPNPAPEVPVSYPPAPTVDRRDEAAPLTRPTPAPTATEPRPPSFWTIFFRHLRSDPQARLCG